MLGFLSMPGGSEWLVVLVIFLLLFGRRLPEVMRSMGRGVSEFKKGVRDAANEVEKVEDDVKSPVSEQEAYASADKEENQTPAG